MHVYDGRSRRVDNRTADNHWHWAVWIKQKQSKLRGTKNSESLQPEYECMWFRQKETSSSSLPHKNSWGLFGFLSWFSKIEIRGSRLHTGICMKTIQALQALRFGVPIPISFFIVFCPSLDSFLYILPNFSINFLTS